MIALGLICSSAAATSACRQVDDPIVDTSNFAKQQLINFVNVREFRTATKGAWACVCTAHVEANDYGVGADDTKQSRGKNFQTTATCLLAHLSHRPVFAANFHTTAKILVS
jgi:hypothetical protein